MLYAFAFLSGAACSALLDWYSAYRRKVRHEAWQTVVDSQRMPLSEVYRRQGFYDTPEIL